MHLRENVVGYAGIRSFMKTGNIGCSVEKKAVIRKNYIYGVLMIIFGGITIPRRESV